MKNLKSDIYRCARNWTFWASGQIYQGRLYNLTASINVLTEAVVLEKSPPLININQGGRVTLPALVNRFCGVVDCDRLN